MNKPKRCRVKMKCEAIIDADVELDRDGNVDDVIDIIDVEDTDDCRLINIISVTTVHN